MISYHGLNFDIKKFDSNELFGIKVRDYSVASGIKVAVLGRFDIHGSVRPGFKVNMLSSMGVGSTHQIIRFEDSEDAKRWIRQNGSHYEYDQDEFKVMTNRSGYFVRLPLCDFDTDVWVNTYALDYFPESVFEKLRRYCPGYFQSVNNAKTNSSRNDAEESSGRYRGFRF